MSKKYELTDETMLFKGRTLHRIRALKDFGDVKKGDLGGFIESEENLSQYGKCWIYGENEYREAGKVYGTGYELTRICRDAQIFGVVSYGAVISGEALIGRDAEIQGLYEIKGKVSIYRLKLIRNGKIGYDALSGNFCLDGCDVSVNTNYEEEVKKAS